MSYVSFTRWGLNHRFKKQYFSLSEIIFQIKKLYQYERPILHYLTKALQVSIFIIEPQEKKNVLILITVVVQ